ncbi:MAG: hypothetical protein PG980_000570 [Wolbachia endosymbiont of Ctenocephalides felis wCfeJ]|nr:MAG: hypothetical protein PG980_000570 [Wolbachia endosymbiont of Ctenocephalides felis wCfeJ]
MSNRSLAQQRIEKPLDVSKKSAYHVAEAIYLSSVCADKMTKNSMYLASHV